MSSARACVVSDERADRVILWVWQTRVLCFVYNNPTASIATRNWRPERIGSRILSWSQCTRHFVYLYYNDLKFIIFSHSLLFIK